MVRAGLAALIAWVPVAQAADYVVLGEEMLVVGERPAPSVGVSLVASAEALDELGDPDRGLVVVRMHARPVAFTGRDLHPAAREAYGTWRLAATRHARLGAQRDALVAEIDALLATWTYPEIPRERLKVPGGAGLVIADLLARFAAASPEAAESLSAPLAIAEAERLAGEDGGLVAFEDWLKGPFLRRLDVERAVLHTQADASREILVVVLEGAGRPLSAEELLLLAQLRFDLGWHEQSERSEAMRAWAAGGAVPADLGGVVEACEEFSRRFGDGHPYASEVLYLEAWALLDALSGARDPGRGAAVLERLLAVRPDGAVAEQARFLLAEAAFELDDFEAALPHYRALSEGSGADRFHALYKRAWCEWRLGRHEEALETLHLVLVDPAPQASRVRDEALAQAAESIADPGGAAEALPAWLAAHGDPPYARDLWLATEAATQRMGLYDDAVAVMHGIVERWPELPDNPARVLKIASLHLTDPLGAVPRAEAVYGQLATQFGEGSEWWSSNALPAQQAAEEPLHTALRQRALLAHVRAQETREQADFAEAADRYTQLGERFDLSREAEPLAFFQAAALAGAQRSDEALAALLALGAVPQAHTCSRWQLEIDLWATSPAPDQARLADAERAWREACLGDGSRALAGVRMASTLAELGAVEPATELLAAAWTARPDVGSAVRHVVGEIGARDPLRAAAFCVDRLPDTRGWSECRQARKSAGKRLVLGRKDA